MSKCVISKKVRIPKEYVSREEIESDLILLDSRPEDYATREPFVCFKELSKNYIVPKMYGLNLIQTRNLPHLDIQKDGDDVDISFSGSLRECQFDPVEKTILALKEVQGGVMCLYCGFGKTTCSLHISCHIKKKVIILVHTTALLEQWKSRIEQFVKGSSVGRIQRDTVDVEDRTHVIALMQSVSKRDYEKSIFDSFGLMIVDEAHHVCAEQLSKCIGKIGCRLRLGLSATPDRKDGMTRFLYDSIGPICARVEREPEKINVDMVNIVNGPSDMVMVRRKGKESPNMARMITNLCEKEESRAVFRTGLIINVINNCYESGRHIMVLSDRRIHLKTIGSILKSMGVDVGFLVGGIATKDIEEISKCKVIMATFAYCSEGVDIPSLDTCVFATPRSDIIQCCGRILRYCPGKQVPYIVDFVDENPVFIGQSIKRRKYYKKLGASVLKVDEEMNIIKSVKRKKVEPEEEFMFSDSIF